MSIKLSFKSLACSPGLQCAVLTCAAAVLMIVNRIMGVPGYEWLIGALIIFIYEIINPICILWTDKTARYVVFSILFYVLLFFLMPVLATAISVKSITQVGSSAMVYLVVIYYPLFLGAGCAVNFVMKRKKR